MKNKNNYFLLFRACKRHSRFRKAALALVLCLLSGCLAGQRAVPSSSASPASAQVPASLKTAKAQVAAFYESGQFTRQAEAVATQAREWISQALAQPSERKAAVVFGLDDTLLSNYARLKSRDFARPDVLAGSLNLPKALLSSPLPATPAMQDLFAYARDHGAVVFIVADRPESERQEVVENLYKAGYAGWAGLLLLPPGEERAPLSEVKAKLRAFIEERGLRIVANVGCKDEDLAGGHAERTFRLPNPLY